VITVQAVINNVTKTFTLNNAGSVRKRDDLGSQVKKRDQLDSSTKSNSQGLDDVIQCQDLNEASLVWNLRIRFDNSNIYTNVGKDVLVSVNPYR